MEEKENNLAEEELDTLEEMEQEQEQNTTELLDLVKSKHIDAEEITLCTYEHESQV